MARLSLKFLLVVVVVVTQRTTDAILEPGVVCLDDDVDFGNGQWINGGDFKMAYAEDSSSLPGVLQGQMEGRGIFYASGLGGDNYTSMRFVHRTCNLPAPTYMYVKYYGHVTTLDNYQRMSVLPALDGNDGLRQNLSSTENFVWGEQLVEIDMGAELFDINVHEQNFTKMDYFLLDKVIITYGLPVGDIDDIVKLCPSGGGIVTTPLPPGETKDNRWPCTIAEYSADPQDRTKYHLSRPNEVGHFLDTIFTCPQGTVWCQQELQCQFPHICP